MAFKILRKNYLASLRSVLLPFCGFVYLGWARVTKQVFSRKFDVAPFIDRRCKHPVEEIQAAVDGAVSREQAAKLKECLLHIDQLNEHTSSSFRLETVRQF